MEGSRKAFGLKAKAVLIAVLLLATVQASRQGAFHKFLANDYVPFWAGAKVALTGGNPYSFEQVLAAENEAYPGSQPLKVFSPPWAIAFLLPFAALSFELSAVLWLIVLGVATFACATWLWSYYGGRPERAVVPFLLTACFMPAMIALRQSQMTPLVLLGIVGFMMFERKNRDFPAGASLFLACLKPHLLGLFWIVLLLWVVKTRRWRVLVGLGTALVVTTAGILVVDHQVFAQYRASMAGMPIWDRYAPMYGGLLRLIFGVQLTWLQYLPGMLGTVWVVADWFSGGSRCSWAERMPVVLLASLLTASYAWRYDGAILLPVVVVSAVRLESGPRKYKLWALALFLCANAVIFWQASAVAHEVWLLWTTPVWIAGYVAVGRLTRNQPLPASAGAVAS